MKLSLPARPVLLIASLGLFLNLASWVLIFAFPLHESAAILHYTSTVGIDFVGEGKLIIALPATGALILALNLIVGRLIVDQDSRTAWLLWGAAPLVQIILIMALLFLQSLN